MPRWRDQVPGSFRDSAGSVLDRGGKIIRVCSEEGSARLAAVESTGLLACFVTKGYLLPFDYIKPPQDLEIPSKGCVLEHPRLQFISYPYEWSFIYLKRAAIFHLQMQLEAFDAGIILIDATPFNIQFVDSKPIFIDHLSFAPYTPGELWWGYDQFLRGFLNPLMLASTGRREWRALSRSMLGAIDPETTRSLLPLRQRIRPSVFKNICVPALLQRDGAYRQVNDVAPPDNITIPARQYRSLLTGLINLIKTLSLPQASSHWIRYVEECNYDADETRTKRAFVARYCQEAQPRVLVDLGCNTGEFTRVAVENGVATVVAIDSDAYSIEAFAQDAEHRQLNVIPLVVDLLDPTPAVGWRNYERASFLSRCTGQSTLALALTHHMAITGQVPLSDILEWITGTFSDGIVEFIPLDDPMAQRLMQFARARPVDYSIESFEATLRARATIISSESTTSSGRMLYHFRSRP